MSSLLNLKRQNSDQQRALDYLNALSRHVTERPAATLAPDFRWQFSQYNDTAMTIGSARVTRNGNVCAWSSSGADDVSGLSVDGTWYIFVTLSSVAGAPPGLIPDTLTLDKDTVWPTDTLENEYIVLGHVVVSGNVIQSFQQYVFSDIDDHVTQTDALSMGHISTAGANEAKLQINGWDVAAAATPYSSDLVMSKAWSTGLPKFTSFSSVLSWIEDNITTEGLTSYLELNDTDDISYADKVGFVPRVNEGHTGLVLTDITNGFVPHTGLDFSGSGDVGEGNSGGNTDQDDAYWHVYNDGVHAGFVDDKELRTVAALWMAGVHVSPDGATDPQYWTAAACCVDVTGAITLHAGTASTWTLDDNLTIKSGASATKTLNLGAPTSPGYWGLIRGDAKNYQFSGMGVGSGGTCTIYAFDTVSIDTVATIIGKASSAINLKGAGTANLYLGASGDLFAGIYYNNVAGRDIPDFITKGGVTGPTIQRLRVQALNADTGADMFFEVLGIPI